MIIDGTKLANSIKKEIQESLKNILKKPKLGIIYIEKNEESEIFIKYKKKFGRKVGIEVELFALRNNVSISKIASICNKLNKDPKYTGYLIQLPIQERFINVNILDFIDHTKDVDALTSTALGRVLKGEKTCLKPATVEGIIMILKSQNIDLKSKRITIVNDSILIGKPLACYLLQKKATVVVCNKYTKNLKLYTKDADVLITATGQKHLITSDFVKKESIVIDAGIKNVNGKVFGDVDYENVSKIVRAITPVPGGVGPLTVACLFKNLVQLHNEKNKRY